VALAGEQVEGLGLAHPGEGGHLLHGGALDVVLGRHHHGGRRADVADKRHDVPRVRVVIRLHRHPVLHGDLEPRQRRHEVRPQLRS